jgi:two-component system sensor histidine kinase/response regulator
VTLSQLKKFGSTADCVLNGLEALGAMSESHYDLILMDCQMPEMDGYQATRVIRAREKASASDGSPPVYIIAMTADAMQGARERCLQAGMNDYVSKPVSLPVFKSALVKWLSTRDSR